MYHSEDHASTVTDKIYSYQQMGFLTNLSLSTKDEISVDCHGVVLIAISEFFKELFEEDSSDAGINVLDVNTTSDILTSILQFLYTGTTDVHAHNVELVLRQSILVQLHQLSQQCIDFVAYDLTVGNVIQYFELSVNLQYEPLSMITSAYIKNNCAQVVAKEHLTKLSIKDLKVLLACMNTEGAETHKKVDIILQWLTNHKDCNESAELLNGIQFNELTIDFLKSIKDNPVFEHNYKLLVQESLNMRYEEELVKQRQTIDKQQQLTIGKRLLQRKQRGRKKQKRLQQRFHQKQRQESIDAPQSNEDQAPQEAQKEYLIMITKSKQLSRYDDIAKRWSAIMNVPDWADLYTSSYASENRIILAGASTKMNGNRVAVLDIKSKKVKELPRLPDARMYLSVVVDDDEVYIIGGWDSSCTWTYTNTMYCSNITKNIGWTRLQNMPDFTVGSIISADRDHIYVFGGYGQMATQIYNKHTKQWFFGEPMPAACNMYNGRCLREGSRFTIFTRYIMMTYHSTDNRWEVIKEYTPYDGFSLAVVSYKDDILSCGIHKNTISSWDGHVWAETDIDTSDITRKDLLFKIYMK